jgi:hypothetical protein
MYQDRAIYVGEFRNSMVDGEGNYGYPNGDVYEGEWYMNKRHGKGRYVDKKGNIY